MASDMEELINLLSEKEQAMEELTLLLAEERRCISALEIESLLKNCDLKEENTARLARLKNKCSELLQLASAGQELHGSTTLSTVIAAAGAPDQARLRALQQRLTKLALQLERQLALNGGILDSSLAMIGSSMTMFAKLFGGGETYGARGLISSCGMGGSILRREI